MLPLLNESVNLAMPINFEDYPTYTFYVDSVARQIVNFTDGLEAMRQAVEIIFAVERYRWQIFSPNFGIELTGLIGEDFGFVTSELKRRINEALIPDNRILGASDYVFTQIDTDSVYCAFTVNTVFGNFQTEVEMRINV